jgi:hypothetical protein
MGATEHEGSSIAPQDAARAADPQPRSPGPRRRSSERSSSSRRSGSRRNIRAGYFALAAIWGCLAGTGVLVVGLSSFDHPVRLDPSVAGLLGLAMILAVGGGLVAAAAYRAASRHLR